MQILLIPISLNISMCKAKLLENTDADGANGKLSYH